MIVFWKKNTTCPAHSRIGLICTASECRLLVSLARRTATVCMRAFRSNSAHTIRNTAVGSASRSIRTVASCQPPVTSNHRSSWRVIATALVSSFAMSARQRAPSVSDRLLPIRSPTIPLVDGQQADADCGSRLFQPTLPLRSGLCSESRKGELNEAALIAHPDTVPVPLRPSRIFGWRAAARTAFAPLCRRRTATVRRLPCTTVRRLRRVGNEGRRCLFV